ncbi:MAG TPA: hypothetical protein VFX30_13785, partial [bacterium]|nr:hypothetical protein [bacterium]
GLAHKLRGRPSNNGKPHAFRKRVCDLYALEYKPRGINYWRFYHEIARSLPEYVSFSTVRRWLRHLDGTEINRFGPSYG